MEIEFGICEYTYESTDDSESARRPCYFKSGGFSEWPCRTSGKPLRKRGNRGRTEKVLWWPCGRRCLLRKSVGRLSASIAASGRSASAVVSWWCRTESRRPKQWHQLIRQRWSARRLCWSSVAVLFGPKSDYAGPTLSTIDTHRSISTRLVHLSKPWPRSRGTFHLYLHTDTATWSSVSTWSCPASGTALLFWAAQPAPRTAAGQVHQPCRQWTVAWPCSFQD